MGKRWEVAGSYPGVVEEAGLPLLHLVILAQTHQLLLIFCHAVSLILSLNQTLNPKPAHSQPHLQVFLRLRISKPPARGVKLGLTLDLAGRHGVPL